MRPRVPAVVVVVHVGRRRDQQIDASPRQPLVAVEERLHAHLAVGPSGAGATPAAPVGVVRHLRQLGRHGRCNRVICDVGAADGGSPSEARLVRVVRIVDHRRGERQAAQTRHVGVGLAPDEVLHQQDLALHRRAVERRAGAKVRRGLGVRLRAVRFDRPGVLVQLPDRAPYGVGPHPVGRQLGLRCERRVRIDLEADDVMTGEIGLHQRRADPGERVEHGPAAAVHVPAERVFYELLGKPCDPRRPPVDRHGTVRHERRVAERSGLCSVCRKQVDLVNCR